MCGEGGPRDQHLEGGVCEHDHVVSQEIMCALPDAPPVYSESGLLVLFFCYHVYIVIWNRMVLVIVWILSAPGTGCTVLATRFRLRKDEGSGG